MSDFECSMCGREGGPVDGCGDCNGSARFKVHTVGHTLSEYRSGRVETPLREVNPKEFDPTYGAAKRNV